MENKNPFARFYAAPEKKRELVLAGGGLVILICLVAGTAYSLRFAASALGKALNAGGRISSLPVRFEFYKAKGLEK